jgi:hypoxanthine-DNA glycosylase
MVYVNHNIPPVFDSASKILILGSFPSVKSREACFFYHHPQNQFWKIIASITNEQVPLTIEDKKQLLLRNNIAVWDVIKSCTIEGSDDNSIKNVVPNDLNIILNTAPIVQIYANGTKAYDLHKKYCYPLILKDIIKLPSTSPANAGYSFEDLLEKWKVIHF